VSSEPRPPLSSVTLVDVDVDVDVVAGVVVVGAVAVVVGAGIVLVDVVDGPVVEGAVSGWSDSPFGDVREMYSGAGDVLTDPAMARAAPPVAARAVTARRIGTK
jgi:hypothetical protein